MVSRSVLDQEQLRIRILFVVMLAGFGILLAALWRMQVSHGKSYQRDLLRQSVRRVRLPGIRGGIYDRNGVCLAGNRPSYDVAVYLEELRLSGKWSRTISRVDSRIEEIADILRRPREVTAEDIKTHTRKRLPLPFVAWRDVDDAALARLAEHAATMPGVDVVVEAVREYPLSNSACHVVGYVGRADPPQDEDQPYHYYLPEMTGKSGIEKIMDGVLRGEAGGRLVRVDVSGFRYDDLASRAPKAGSDVILSLDSRAQKLVEAGLEGVRGAGVILDPNTGDVLAMASAPGFDPNEFAPTISSERWEQFMADPEKPLINRAVAAAYAPGSTFKPVVACAALESHKANPQTSFTCPGYFILGRARFRCWYNPGHGLLDLQQGLEHSCNVYFFRLGLLTGPESIESMAAALGFGQKTGIALDYEAPGLLPDDGWKRRNAGDGWRDGDTCNLSIGQGFLTATPLQMAVFTAAIANGGTLYKPRLVQGVRAPGEAKCRLIPPQVVNTLNWSPTTLRTVRGGMHDVVMSARGTGRLAQVADLEMAGKTGTAEIGRKGEGHKIGWMIAFAPFDHPRYAVVLMVEEAVTGGTTVAPRMQKVMDGLFQNEKAGEGQG